MSDKRWNLDKIIPLEDLDLAISDFNSMLSDFKGSLVDVNPQIDNKDFKRLVTLLEQIEVQLTKIYFRSNLQEEADTSDIKAKQMVGKSKDLIIKSQDIIRPFLLWLKGTHELNGLKLDEQNAKRLFASIRNLTYFFSNERQKAKYSLSSKEEAIITRKDITGTHTLLDVRDRIESKQNYKLEIDGKELEFNNIAELAPYFHSPVRETRKKAYNSLFGEYLGNRLEYFMIYQAIVKDWNHEKDLRGYSSAIAVRNIDNGINDTIIDVLLRSCEKNLFIFRDFFKLKSKFLGLKEFDRYDIYAPVNKDGDKIISLDEAKRIITNNYENKDEQLGKMVKEMFSSNVIDYLPRKNKKGGGFCAPIAPDMNPYILLNYTGIKRDFMTMAHEMGHALHSKLSGRNSILTYNAPLILAETGSTIGEMINFDSLLGQANQKGEIIEMLFEKLGDIYASVIRQIYFVKFELKAHEMLTTGCSVDELDKAYLMNLKEQFGDSVTIPDIFKHEWLYIPHIVHSPFYCYSYPFGELLGFSLYEDSKKDGTKGLKTIKSILSSGSSQDPLKLLLEQGYDLSSDKIWEKGFAYIASLLEQLRSML